MYIYTIIILFTYLKIHEVLEGYNLISADVFAVIVCIIVISMPRAYQSTVFPSIQSCKILCIICFKTQKKCDVFIFSVNSEPFAIVIATYKSIHVYIIYIYMSIYIIYIYILFIYGWFSLFHHSIVTLCKILQSSVKLLEPISGNGKNMCRE